MLIAPPYSRLAPLYDAALGIPFFRGVCRSFEDLVRRYRIRFRSVADLGCGTGLFARYLSRRWHTPVVGVDRAEAMLLEAARHCRDSDVTFLCQDLRQLQLPQPVDLATINFDTVNHLLTRRDLCVTLRQVAHNLRPGGHLIFDFLTDCQPFHEFIAGALRRRGSGVRQFIRWIPQRRMLSVGILVEPECGGPRIAEHHGERMYAPAEVAQCLLESGFTIRGVHDASTLHSAARCTPRLVVVAQKTA